MIISVSLISISSGTNLHFFLALQTYSISFIFILEEERNWIRSIVIPFETVYDFKKKNWISMMRSTAANDETLEKRTRLETCQLCGKLRRIFVRFKIHFPLIN